MSTESGERLLSQAIGSSLRRWLFAVAGVFCVALAFVGVFVPGLPTTVFLITASYLFTRSCPWLEEKLVRHRVFSAYLRYVDRREPMPSRTKIATVAVMWTAVLSSVAYLHFAAGSPVWLLLSIVAAGLAGAWTVIRL